MNQTQVQKVKAHLHLLDTQYPLYQIKGQETLGKAQEYSLSFVSAKALSVETLADTNIRFTLQDEKDASQQREIHAKVFAVTQENKVGDKHLYTLLAVHPMKYLETTKRYEIYQEKSAYEIIDTLLKRYSALLEIDFHTKIDPRKFIKREYTTQYGQSDLDFIHMLCQQEGITLWMQNDKKPYVVRLAHIKETYEKHSADLKCSYNLSKTFAPTHSIEDYYDFKDPSKDYQSSTGKTPLSQSLKDNKHSAQLRHDLKLITHRDRLEEPRESDLKNHSKHTAGKSYSQAETITGQSISLFTKAGLGAKLLDVKAAQKTEAIFTQVTLEGYFPNALDEYVEEQENIQQYLFECTFEATAKETVFVPNYEIVKPQIASAVTAIVSSGKKETESTPNTIDIDNLGRIRVLFHFEQIHTASCYIRFANFSAGDGWGSQFIPRVNTEVIVNFLNGDPDRPVAIGSLYNGNNKLPKDLPSKKTQSYIKTQSMPGGKEEYNLLLFEDKAKEEIVHIRAQKDYKLHALHDANINIDHNQTEAVGNDESFSVGNDRSKSIGHDETTDVGNDRTESVGKDETISVGNNQSISIGKDQETQIGKNQATKIEKDMITHVGNHRIDEVHVNHEVKTGGNFKHTVSGKMDVKAGTHIKSVTKLHEMHGSERIVFKSKGGTIIIDGAGITLKGNVQIKGNVAISGGSAGGAEAISARVNEGTPFCYVCMLKEMGLA